MHDIPLVNLRRMHDDLGDELRDAIGGAVRRGDYILGTEVEAFEREFADYCGAAHCVGVASGLDALTLALAGMGVGAGDEVITAANTFVATALAIHRVGATPVLVEHDPVTYAIDPRAVAAAITSRTRAIIPVHLYGHPADMDAIRDVAARAGCVVIEDAAQAHGARYKGRRCGSLGDAGAFSFYPGKNLGAMGDAGAVVTDNGRLADWLRAARNYGSPSKHRHVMCGWNSRLDNVQAAILRVKLRHLDAWNHRRRALAARYREKLASSGVILPLTGEDVEPVYHLFVVRCLGRDGVLAELHERGIGASIHYPQPIHRLEAFASRCVTPLPTPYAERFADELLSLPLCPYLKDEEADAVADAVYDAHRGAPSRRATAAPCSLT